MRSYDYAHRQGVRTISWEEFATLTDQLAEALEQAGVEVIVGVARAGLLPATVVACHLRRELYPVRITRRVNDEVRFSSPVWRVPVSPEVAGKTVAVIDEIADTGETLALVESSVQACGAVRTITACLVRHSWANPVPTISLLVTNELVICPWDQQVLMEGQWRQHPEILAAFAAQQKDSL